MLSPAERPDPIERLKVLLASPPAMPTGEPLPRDGGLQGADACAVRTIGEPDATFTWCDRHGLVRFTFGPGLVPITRCPLEGEA